MDKLAKYLLEADSSWWEKLTVDEQEEYMKEHPLSKLTKDAQARAAKNNKDSNTTTNKATNPQHPVASHIKAAVDDLFKTKPKEAKVAATIGKDVLQHKNVKPSLLYKLGTTLAYSAASGALMTAAGLTAVSALATPGSGVIAAPIITSLVAGSLYFDAKSYRRLLGYGGKYTDYDNSQKPPVAKKEAKAAVADSIDPQTTLDQFADDKAVLSHIYNRVINFIQSGAVSVTDIIAKGESFGQQTQPASK